MYEPLQIIERLLYHSLQDSRMDAFGLPAENYAIKMGGTSCKINREDNAVANIKRRLTIVALI